MNFASHFTACMSRGQRQSRPSGFISGVMAEARASEIYQSQMESDASHNAVVDTINTWTDRALNVAIYQVLKDYPGLASISDAVKGDATEVIFDFFREDNSEDAESEAIDELEESLTAHSNISRDAVKSAILNHDLNLTETEVNSLANGAAERVDTGYRLGNTPLSPNAQ